MATLGLDYVSKTFTPEGTDQELAVKIWDTAGQERFRTLTHAFYKQANGVVVAFDVSNRESFDNVKKWMESIFEHADQNICKVMVGNKIDIEDRRVTKTREVEGHRTLIVGGGSLYCWSTVSLVCIPPNKTLCFYLRLDKRLNTNQRNRRQKTSCTVIILTTVSVRWLGDSRKDFKVGSVTRWLDYLSYIWPLITIKICL